MTRQLPSRQYCLAILLTLLCLPASANSLTGRVVGIADGDTLTVLDAEERQVKVRLQGIDAPETKMPFSAQSKQSLAACAFGKAVTVEWKEIDRYGRTVGKVLADGIDCNLRQITAGLAWHYKKYESRQAPADRVAYAEAEIAARTAKRGLWVDPEPTPPWEWRH